MQFLQFILTCTNYVINFDTDWVLLCRHVRKQVGYYFAPSGKPYPDNWIITDIIYELEGSLYSR